MALALWRPSAADFAPGDSGVCTALQVVAEPALYDRVPPPDASPELEEFVKTLNIEIALVRRQIKEACSG